MRVRESARAVLLDPVGRVLLLLCEDARAVGPADPGLTRYWATPGGGVEAGEDGPAALRRELREELGLAAVSVGPLVAERTVVLHLAGQGPTRCEESYFLCRTGPDPAIRHDGMGAAERSVLRGARWWSRAELAAEAPVVRPRRLPELLRAEAGPVLRLD